MQEVQENFQVEGNKEVNEFIDRWKAIVAKGKINFVGIVACQSATEVFMDHVGVIGTEFGASWAARELEKQITGNIYRRMAPAASATAPANKVVYNMASAPCSFDFLAWLMTAEMRRVKEGAEGPLQVAFSFGQDQDKERSLVTMQRRTMFENIMKPLIPMMGAVEVPIAEIGPARWTDVYTLKDATALCQEGIASPRVKPSQEAVDKVEQYLNGRRPVVIVLREAEHWSHRNSNQPEWFKFIDTALAHEDVIVLRDTRFATEPLGPYHTLPPCSLELNSRVALFERAKCVIGVGNGPMTLLFHMDTPYLMFGAIDPSGSYAPGRPEWWKPHHGIAPGEQFPWSNPHQRIIWEMDTAANLTRAWKKLVEDMGAAKQIELETVKKLAAPKVKAKAKIKAKSKANGKVKPHARKRKAPMMLEAAE